MSSLRLALKQSLQEAAPLTVPKKRKSGRNLSDGSTSNGHAGADSSPSQRRRRRVRKHGRTKQIRCKRQRDGEAARPTTGSSRGDEDRHDLFEDGDDSDDEEHEFDSDMEADDVNGDDDREDLDGLNDDDDDGDGDDDQDHDDEDENDDTGRSRGKSLLQDSQQHPSAPHSQGSPTSAIDSPSDSSRTNTAREKKRLKKLERKMKKIKESAAANRIQSNWKRAKEGRTKEGDSTATASNGALSYENEKTSGGSGTSQPVHDSTSTEKSHQEAGDNGKEQRDDPKSKDDTHNVTDDSDSIKPQHETVRPSQEPDELTASAMASQKDADTDAASSARLHVASSSNAHPDIVSTSQTTTSATKVDDRHHSPKQQKQKGGPNGKNHSSSSSGKSKTVSPPARNLLEWARSLSEERCRRHICSGLRVKVRFATKVRREGKVLTKKKWYGGRVSAVSKKGSKVRIKYDDGTTEVSKFPDKDVVVDDTNNGRHVATAEHFIPPSGSVRSADSNSEQVDDKATDTVHARESQSQSTKPSAMKSGNVEANGKAPAIIDTVADSTQPKTLGRPQQESHGDIQINPDPPPSSSAQPSPQPRSETSILDTQPVLESSNTNLDDVDPPSTTAAANEDLALLQTAEQKPVLSSSPSYDSAQPDVSLIAVANANVDVKIVDTNYSVQNAADEVEKPSDYTRDPIDEGKELTASNAVNTTDSKKSTVDASASRTAGSSHPPSTPTVGDVAPVVQSKATEKLVPLSSADTVKSGVMDVETSQGSEMPEDGGSATAQPKTETQRKPSLTIRLPSMKRAIEAAKGMECGSSSSADLEGTAKESASEIHLDTVGRSAVAPAENTVASRPNSKSDRSKKWNASEMERETNGTGDTTSQPIEPQASKRRIQIKGIAPSVIKQASTNATKLSQPQLDGVFSQQLASVDERAESTIGSNTSSPDLQTGSEDSVEASTDHPKCGSSTSGDLSSGRQASPAEFSDAMAGLQNNETEPRSMLTQSLILDSEAHLVQVASSEKPGVTESSSDLAGIKEGVVGSDGKTPKDKSERVNSSAVSSRKTTPSDEAGMTVGKLKKKGSSESLPSVQRTGRRAAQEAKERMSGKEAHAVESAKGKKKRKKEGDNHDSETSDQEPEWVQCDRCEKWRTLPPGVDATSLPHLWYCEMNHYDPKRNTCAAPQQTAKQAARERKKAKKRRKRLENGSVVGMDAVSERSARTSDISRKPAEVGGPAESSRISAIAPAIAKEVKPKARRASPSSNPTTTNDKLTSTTTAEKEVKKRKKIRSQESQDTLGSQDPEGRTKSKFNKKRNRPQRSDLEKDSPEKENVASSSVLSSKEKKEDADNVAWVQCEKCNKWRKLPPEIVADDLPDTWYCTMNTWNPPSASCEAPEDKADALHQDVNPTGPVAPPAPGKFSYRSLIFGNGKKHNRPTSERTRAAESIFAPPADNCENPHPVVLYAKSSAFLPRVSNFNKKDVVEVKKAGIFDIMSKSNLWETVCSSGHAASNESRLLRRNRFFHDLGKDDKELLKQIVIHAIGISTMTSEEVLAECKFRQWDDIPAAWIQLRADSNEDVVVNTLLELVRDGVLEMTCNRELHKPLSDWVPRYRLCRRRRYEAIRDSPCMKIAKPWKQRDGDDSHWVSGSTI